MTYFDSCYLAKLYLMEQDSPKVREHAAALGNLVCCSIGWGEILATLHRHLREGRLTPRHFQLLTAQVEADLQNEIWTPLPVTQGICEAQARRIAKLPNTVFLRAADALHLTCAAEAGLKAIYSSDRHLIAAAPHFGLKPITL